MTRSRNLLELTDVRKQYVSPDGEASVEVLGGIDLQVATGESIAIVGPSGSGKSTLLNLIGALDYPTSGEILFDGESLPQLSERELTRVRNEKIGFVFQQHHLLPQCTVLENVLIPALARKKGRVQQADEDRARDLLQQVGLSHRLTHRPGQLSGGECQRVAVVRALINSPRLLLADEPTGSLDNQNSRGLTQLLVQINQESGTTLVVVTHSMTVAGEMRRALRLADGALVQESDADEPLDAAQT